MFVGYSRDRQHKLGWRHIYRREPRGAPILRRVASNCCTRRFACDSVRKNRDLRRYCKYTRSEAAAQSVCTGGKNAAGRNPVSILITCRRAAGAGGTLTGYTAGISFKSSFLAVDKQWEKLIIRLPHLQIFIAMLSYFVYSTDMLISETERYITRSVHEKERRL